MKNIFAIVLLIGVLNLNSMEKTYQYRQHEKLIEQYPREVGEYLLHNNRIRRRNDHLSRFRRLIQRHYYDFIRL